MRSVLLIVPKFFIFFIYFFFYSRFNKGLQGAGDKAEPGRMNFSSVSREASLQHRGVPLFSISVRAEEEAILVVSGGLTF